MLRAVVGRPFLLRRSRLILRALPRSETSPAAASRMVLKCSSSGVRGDGGGDESESISSNNPNSRPGVAKIQQLVSKDSFAGWEDCWKEGTTPWDLGQPTPVIVRLLENGTLPKGQILVPGCGTGYDVAAIAGPERYVIGLDVSETAIKKAQELLGSSQNLKYFTFVAEDFFTWHPNELFDLIIDYTFFCAINPCLRSKWASQMQDFLKPEGELITLMFPIGQYEGGPPYAVSLSAYEDVLHPLRFKAISISDNELAVGARKGREKLVRWKKAAVLSPL